MTKPIRFLPISSDPDTEQTHANFSSQHISRAHGPAGPPGVHWQSGGGVATKPPQRSPKEEVDFELRCELLQPWSTFVMKTKLPDTVFEKMLKITDEIVANPETAQNWGPHLAGEIEHEFGIARKILEREEIMEYFLNVVKAFVIRQSCQSFPPQANIILNDEYSAEMQSMWVVSQKDNEYNPIHHHNQCSVSTIMYLKIPEYLPSRKNPNSPSADGAICFVNNAARDAIWGSPSVAIQPAVGDFFIFPASQQHLVYPFRTADGKGERRSVSFNANFSSKFIQEEEKIEKSYLQENG